MFFDRRKFLEELREQDPHGRKSDNEIERLADLEQLEWDIHDIEDVSDVRMILFRMLNLIRTA